MKKYIPALIIVFLAATVTAQDCSEVFFSEYGEGSGNNKFFELYNPTDQTVDLSSYVIKRYSNGSPVPTSELTLSGTIQPFGVVVVTNGQEDSVWVSSGQFWSPAVDEALLAKADLTCSGIYPTPMYFNGDDAMTLETVTGKVLDIFGKIGDYPGDNGWNDIPPNYIAGAEWWTSWSINHTLIRKNTVKQGVLENPPIFMVNMEWDSLANNYWDDLGTHLCDCGVQGTNELDLSPSFVMYPNPLASNELTISSDTPVVRIEISNILGQRVLAGQYGGGENTIKIEKENLHKGVYLVRVYFDNDRSYLQKLIVR